MAVRFLFRGAGVLALLAFALAPPAWGVLYNFNSQDGGWTVTSESLTPPEKPWTWILGASSTQGGWQAWRGADAFQSASYLVSPLLVVDNVDGSYVRMDIRHRFDFGGTGTSPLLALGQVQYQINNGSWLGIRSDDFLATSGKIPPSYPNPPYPFIDQTLAPPTGTYAVDAWYETTTKFINGDHQDSQFTLDFPPYQFGPGDLIRFRFLVATQTPLSGTGSPVIDWEINKVQIDGVDPAVVPEPGALVLAGIGGLGYLIVVSRRRRSRVVGAVAGSTAVTVVVVFTIVCALAATPARAGPTTWWDFQQSSGNWTTSAEGYGYINPDKYWMYTGTMASLPANMTGGTSPHWHVISQGVSPTTRTAYYLTSPVIAATGSAGPALGARISIAHDFLFPSGTNGEPLTTGQVEFRFNESGPWVGLPLSAFTNGGSVFGDFPPYDPSPFNNSGTLRYVNQSSFVAPNYLLPTGTAAFPFGDPGKAAFTGTTPGWPTAYVPSQAFITASTGMPVDGITSLQVRFANLNLWSNCGCGTNSWNIRYVQVDFPDDTPIPPVPEPGAIALGTIGLALLTGKAALRHLTTAPPGRARSPGPPRPRRCP